MALANRVRAGLLSAALVAGFLLAGGPYAGTAHACSCSGVPSVEAQFEGSDAVFKGKMVRGGVGDPAPNDCTTVGGIEFRVIESWKGGSGESAVVYGQGDSYYGELEEGQIYAYNSCAFEFAEGKSYLVYASRQDDVLGVDVCSRTTSLANAEEDIRALGPPSGQLTNTGGPPLPAVGGLLLAATAALSLLAVCAVGILNKWTRL